MDISYLGTQLFRYRDDRFDPQDAAYRLLSAMCGEVQVGDIQAADRLDAWDEGEEFTLGEMVAIVKTAAQLVEAQTVKA
jgi:hypothetical protein